MKFVVLLVAVAIAVVAYRRRGMTSPTPVARATRNHPVIVVALFVSAGLLALWIAQRAI